MKLSEVQDIKTADEYINETLDDYNDSAIDANQYRSKMKQLLLHISRITIMRQIKQGVFIISNDRECQEFLKEVEKELKETE